MKLWLPGQCGTDVKIDMDQGKRTDSPAASANAWSAELGQRRLTCYWEEGCEQVVLGKPAAHGKR